MRDANAVNLALIQHIFINSDPNKVMKNVANVDSNKMYQSIQTMGAAIAIKKRTQYVRIVRRLERIPYILITTHSVHK